MTIYMCIHTFMYIHSTYIYASMYAGVCVSMYVFTYTMYVYIFIYECMYKNMYTCIFSYLHVRMYVYTCMYMYIHVYMYMYVYAIHVCNFILIVFDNYRYMTDIESWNELADLYISEHRLL